MYRLDGVDRDTEGLLLKPPGLNDQDIICDMKFFKPIADRCTDYTQYSKASQHPNQVKRLIFLPSEKINRQHRPKSLKWSNGRAPNHYEYRSRRLPLWYLAGIVRIIVLHLLWFRH